MSRHPAPLPPSVRPLALLLALFLAAPLAGCRSGPDPERMYELVLRDFSGLGGLTPSVLERQEERYAKITEWARTGQLIDPQDHLWAAAALTTSDSTEDLVLAKELALAAAEMGEQRAYLVQAMATDKLLFKQGLPQRYGTQIVYEPLFRRWRLYAVDPATTDEVRKAMGVPPLAELLSQVDELNAGGEATDHLRSATLNWPDPAGTPLHDVEMTTED